MAVREEIITRTDRAVAKAAAGGGKSAATVMQAVLKAGMTAPAVTKETKMQRFLSARCRRLAGQSTVVGTTVIAYDRLGICRVLDQANAAVDFEAHCRQNGVERLPDIVASVGPPAPAAPPQLEAAPVSATEVAPPGAELPPEPAPLPPPAPKFVAPPPPPPAPAPEPEPEPAPAPPEELPPPPAPEPEVVTEESAAMSADAAPASEEESGDTSKKKRNRRSSR